MLMMLMYNILIGDVNIQFTCIHGFTYHRNITNTEFNHVQHTHNTNIEKKLKGRKLEP